MKTSECLLFKLAGTLQTDAHLLTNFAKFI
jgi:hypothetical protein